MKKSAGAPLWLGARRQTITRLLPESATSRVSPATAAACGQRMRGIDADAAILVAAIHPHLPEDQIRRRSIHGRISRQISTRRLPVSHTTRERPTMLTP